MRINRHLLHILILPEDDANRQIANGFILNRNVNGTVIQVLPHDRGWENLLETFINDHLPKIRQFQERRMVLLIDFDKREDRFSYVQSYIPDDLIERVFILGVKSNPEKLRRVTNKSFEGIGEALAEDCAKKTNELWGHDLLEHNRSELDRMILSVRPFLFVEI
ncbi:conserved hypothetical protein [Planktothrix sp. PCC 11201]|uniref:hypothetical protein n=1 Tax=Planktothrix sp. PCC 11201 TaxID=1729650 RepID=UPI000920878D|nr:hypothetical protein [Planktothrix sp. PCC 11201]SKB12232.1 conserved hypothetical protein [Planktothrix sp. PCC 11201]